MARVARPALAPDVIVRAALDCLDEVGLDELSMRRLATVLGVQNPALYWHVKNKQELLDRMAQALLAAGFAAAEAGPAPRAWDTKLRRLAVGFRASMLARRDGARVIAGADLDRGPELQTRMTSLIAVLRADGFGPVEARAAVLTVIHYTLGATFEQQADPRGAGAVLTQADLERRFELGVEIILAGLRARQNRA